VSGFKYPSVFRKNKGIFLRVAIFFALLISGLALPGCDEKDLKPKADDHSYFPLRKGAYLVYDVEHITYELGVPDTLRYQLRTVVIDSFRNVEGSFTYVIQRTRKYAGTTTWVSDGTWSARLTDVEAVVTEGSTPYVRLRFPVQTGTEWNGNSYNDEVNPGTGTGQDLYVIKSSGETCDANGMIFEDCLTVIQEDNQEFIIYRDERIEKYARNIGLIFKETIQLHYCNDIDRDCVGQQIIEEGIIYRQLILEYGQG
jgi:hypothetical protein